MKKILAIDIGGTTIKYALWTGKNLQNEGSVTTPKDLKTFYNVIENIKNIFEQEKLDGVAISSPGAVNKKTGVIEGASALPYIHNFNIHKELEELLNLPVTIENDANCAALAEIEDGVGKGKESLALFVIGTGIGGAVVLNRKIWHGAHLHGGEFGFMMTKYDKILSQMGSAVNMAYRYNELTNRNLNGKEVFELANEGDRIAISERDILIETLATAIFNIQHSFDPEVIALGGAISNNPRLLPLVNKYLDKIQSKIDIPTIKPNLKICDFRSKANLRGAVVDFEQNCIK